MALNTAIEWAHDSKNYWQGCVEVAGHPACAFCYARRDLERHGHDVWGKDQDRKWVKSSFSDVAKFERLAIETGEPRRVFINSQSDFFEDHTGPLVYWDINAVDRWTNARGQYVSVALDEHGQPFPLEYGRPHAGINICHVDDLRRLAFRQFDACPHLIILLLTKRPELIQSMWPDRVHRKNVCLGTSVSNQKTAEKFAGALAAVPIGPDDGSAIAPHRYLSVEPFLGRIEIDWRPFSWVIIGCESMPGNNVGRLGFKSEREWCEAAAKLCRAVECAGSIPFVKQIPIDGKVSHDMSKWPAGLRRRGVPLVSVAS